MALFDLWKMAGAAEDFSLSKTLQEQYRLTETPKWNAARCVQGKREKDPCTKCQEVCPKEIYPPNPRAQMPNWSSCLHCGLCAAACPDRCIAVPVRQAERFIRHVGKQGPLHISCKQGDGGEALCLASYSWEQLAYAALGDGLVIHRPSCEACGDLRLQEQVEDRIEKLRFFLGDALFQEKVTVTVGEESSSPQDGFSRRELFRAFVDYPVGNVVTELPALENKQENGLFFRALLRDKVRENAGSQEPEKRHRFRVKLPRFTDSCYNCGACAWKCPQKALKITNEGGYILASVDVWRCTSCGVCQSACKVGGISGMEPMRVQSLGRTALKKIPAYLCGDCGHPRPKDAEEGLCASCMGKRKMERIRAQREHERRVKTQSQE